MATETKKEKRHVAWNILFWAVWFILATTLLADFILLKREKDPMFCLKQSVYEQDNGIVEECIGFTYKVYHYDRDDLQGYEFGSWWLKQR